MNCYKRFQIVSIDFIQILVNSGLNQRAKLHMIKKIAIKRAKTLYA